MALASALPFIVDTFNTGVHVLLDSSLNSHVPLLGVLLGSTAHHVCPWNQAFDCTVVVVSSDVSIVGSTVHVSCAPTTAAPDHMTGARRNWMIRTRRPMKEVRETRVGMEPGRLSRVGMGGERATAMPGGRGDFSPYPYRHNGKFLLSGAFCRSVVRPTNKWKFQERDKGRAESRYSAGATTTNVTRS